MQNSKVNKLRYLNRKVTACLLYGSAGLIIGLLSFSKWGLFSLMGFYPADLCTPKVTERFFNRGGNLNRAIVNKIERDPDLLHCIFSKNKEVAQRLIDNGINVNARIDGDNSTLLFAARNKEIVQLLINNGANVNAKNNSGDNALRNAILFYSEEIVRVLIDNGADVNARDRFGTTPLFYPTSLEVAQLLIDNGADVNVRDRLGVTPLFHIVLRKPIGEQKSNDLHDKDLAQLLIENGTDVNARDTSGRTPLFYAETKGVAEVLIENGADVNARDTSGRTPLFFVMMDRQTAQLAVEYGISVNAKGVAEILIENGADVNARDKYGKTPLSNMESYLKDSQEQLDLYLSRYEDDSYRPPSFSLYGGSSKTLADIKSSLREDITREKQLIAERKRLINLSIERGGTR